MLRVDLLRMLKAMLKAYLAGGGGDGWHLCLANRPALSAARTTQASSLPGKKQLPPHQPARHPPEEDVGGDLDGAALGGLLRRCRRHRAAARRRLRHERLLRLLLLPLRPRALQQRQARLRGGAWAGRSG